MTTKTIEVPADVHRAFEDAFPGRETNAAVAELMRHAVALERQVLRRERGRSFSERAAAIRASSTREYSNEEVIRIRDELRS
jgi:hypothetical protein